MSKESRGDRDNHTTAEKYQELLEQFIQEHHRKPNDEEADVLHRAACDRMSDQRHRSPWLVQLGFTIAKAYAMVGAMLAVLGLMTLPIIIGVCSWQRIDDVVRTMTEKPDRNPPVAMADQELGGIICEMQILAKEKAEAAKPQDPTEDYAPAIVHWTYASRSHDLCVEWPEVGRVLFFPLETVEIICKTDSEKFSATNAAKVDCKVVHDGSTKRLIAVSIKMSPEEETIFYARRAVMLMSQFRDDDAEAFIATLSEDRQRMVRCLIPEIIENIRANTRR